MEIILVVYLFSRHHHRHHHGHGPGHGHGHGHGFGSDFSAPGLSGGFGPQPQRPAYGRYPPPTYPVNQTPQPGGGRFGNRQPGNFFGGPQPGPNLRPQPGQGGDFDRGQPGFQQPGGDFSGRRPGFQQPEGDFSRGQQGGDFRPGQSGFRQPGGDSHRGQPGFRQPEQPQPGSDELPTYSRPGLSPGGFQQPGSGENTQQPRPGAGAGGFQQPGQNQGRQPGSSHNTIQPRPGNNDEDDFSQFNFQTPNTLQPRPGQIPEAGGASSVIQPIPGQTSSRDNVGSNLGDLFNTQDYLSPELSQGAAARAGSERDPKSEAEEVRPESVNQRNLFETDPICTNGTERMAGRCRKKA